MKQVAGIFLPDHEVHLVPHIEGSERVGGKGTYQKRKYDAALALIPKGRRRTALDVGSHVGTWARVMALDFAKVVAFEPVEEHCRLWALNVEAPNATLMRLALGNRGGASAVYVTPGHSGHSMVSDFGETVSMTTLDIIAPTGVDFIKIDAEGYELNIVRGGEMTIRKHQPVIVVEQKPNSAERYGFRQTEAVDLLKSWGAKVEWEIGGDFCLTWEY